MKKLLYLLTVPICALGLFAQPSFFTPDIKLRYAERLIADYYIDTVNEERISEAAIRAMLEELDPHSSYSDPNETKEMNEPLQGNFSGIGITFNLNHDTVYVIQPTSGGPSERVGIIAGDRILACNDTAISGVKMKQSEIKRHLRGPKGSKANLKVLRRSGSKSDTINFAVTRAEIPINSIDAYYMADPHTGYIRLSRFAAETPGEFRKAVSDLKGKGMTQLILDLTDNGGGYLGAAVEILGEILEPGQMAVYTEGRKSPRYDYASHPHGRTPALSGMPIVVMANQNSASASEITAGAIQDWDRGLIVGRRTFGKGLVQRPFPFPDGSMVKLTIAHYYTPTGRDIQKPYTKGDASAYRHDFADRLSSGELMHADSIKHVDSLMVKTLRLKRPIYGGGGISPDRFVPLDTTNYTLYYRDMVAKGIVPQYAISYIDANRKRLKQDYKTEADFLEHFEVTDQMLSDFEAMGNAEGVAPNEEQALTSKPLFKMIIKGLIGRDLYDQAAYQKVFNAHDDIYKEALRLINSPEYNQILSADHD